MFVHQGMDLSHQQPGKGNIFDASHNAAVMDLLSKGRVRKQGHGSHHCPYSSMMRGVSLAMPRLSEVS